MSIRPLPDPSRRRSSSRAEVTPGVRTLRSPEDLLALVPTVFGFHPRDSLVLIGVGASPGVHARVDLPTDPASAREVGVVLSRAAENGSCSAACLVAYCAEPALAADAVTATAQALAEAAIPVAVALHADGTTYSCFRGDEELPGPRVAYDVRDHALVAEAVLAGRVVHADRDDLVASLRPVPALVAEVQRHADAHLDALAAPVGEPGDEGGEGADDLDDPSAEVLGERIHEEARWVSRTARTLLAADALPTPEQAARLLVAMRISLTARDALWCEIDQGRAERAVRLCRHLVQAAPTELRPAPAALLGFAGWLSGDGALGWCGVEAAQEAEPRYSLAGLMAQLLERAVPPSTWVPMRRAELGVPGLD